MATKQAPKKQLRIETEPQLGDNAELHLSKLRDGAIALAEAERFLRKRLTELTAALASAEADLSEEQAAHAATEAELGQVKVAFAATEKNLAKLMDDHGVLKSAHATLTASHTALQNQVAERQNKLNKVQAILS